MKHNHQLPLVVALLLAAAVSVSLAVQGAKQSNTDVLVAADGSGDYASLRDAVKDAKQNSAIRVLPGVYEGGVEVTAEAGPFTIIGAGPDRTVIDANSEYVALALKSDGNRVSGLALRNAESHGLYIPSGHQRISRCLITGNRDRGVYISTMGGGGAANIDHCTIADNTVSNLYHTNEKKKVSITSSILAFSGRNLVFDGNGENVSVSNSCLDSRDAETDKPKTGSNNIQKDPKFVNHEGGDYHLAPGSPCLGTGAKGTNQGCF